MKFLNRILYTLLLFASLSCERKPLYFYGDYMINVDIQVEADVNILWNIGWKDSLKYDWKIEYGPLGYTAPSSVQFVTFDGNILLNEQTIQTNKRVQIDIERDKTYDVLLYNKTPTIESNWIGGRYYIETPSIETRSSIADQYTTVHEPGEVFSTYVRNINLEETEYEIQYEDGKNIYVYNIDAVLNPVSYIYIIQFIVINDDGSEKIEAKDLLNFTVSGVCVKKNLLTGKPQYTGHYQISTFDIKDGQMKGDSLIFASRVTVLDLLPNEEGSSWNTHQNYLYYSVLDFDTYNYGIVTGAKDITKQLNENPRGGIITITILNSEIKAAGGDPGKDGFGINVNEWNQHIIDIPV